VSNRPNLRLDDPAFKTRIFFDIDVPGPADF
jgi:hypothetical protein